jgi:4-hydroxythreonine-4-phosphate dehydrogenase
MLIYNKKLSVSPITTHLPLKEVHKHISKKKIINQVKLIKQFYINEFKKDPKIAVTGLNPHCESNYKSSEEDKIIKPAIKYLIKNGYKIKGPFAADTIFLKEQLKKYDVIVGMYHDQVLTPIKTLMGFDAINITLGLPFKRISPDHGPNVAMLGKNLSSPNSLIQALKFLDK